VLSGYGKGSDPCINAKTEAIKIHFDRILPEFPSTWGKDATLLFADYDHKKKSYRLFTLQFEHPKLILKEQHLTSQFPYFCIGSGAEKALGLISGNNYTTTAQYFRALVNTILDDKIGSVGGVPQMVKLTSVTSQPIGFNWKVSDKMESTLFGMPLAFSSDMSNVRFMDGDFTLSKYLRSGRVQRSS